MSTERMKTRLGVLTVCDMTVETLLDYVEGELDPSLSADLDLHLKNCGSCLNQVAEFKALKKSLKAPLTMPSDDFFKNLENKIMANLDSKTVMTNSNSAVFGSVVALAWARKITIPLAATAALFLLVFGALFKTMRFDSEISPQTAQAKLEEQFMVQAAYNDPEAMTNSIINSQDEADLVMSVAAEKLSRMTDREAAHALENMR